MFRALCLHVAFVLSRGRDATRSNANKSLNAAAHNATIARCLARTRHTLRLLFALAPRRPPQQNRDEQETIVAIARLAGVSEKHTKRLLPFLIRYVAILQHTNTRNVHEVQRRQGGVARAWSSRFHCH